MPDHFPREPTLSPPASAPGRRRGRPRLEEGPAVTADAIVGTGLDAIQANGWSGLALRDVARRLGVSLPAVQRHFPTKDDLWRACIDRLVAVRFAARLDGERSDRPADRLLAALRSQFERSGVDPGLTAAMLQDRSEGAEARIAYLCEAIRPIVEDGRSRLREAIAAGAMRAVDVDVVLAVLGIGLSSLASAGPALERLFGIDLTDVSQRERFATTIADILIFGLRGPDASVRPEQL